LVFSVWGFGRPRRGGRGGGGGGGGGGGRGPPPPPTNESLTNYCYGNNY